MNKLRNALLQYRQTHNLTQQELSDYIGVSRNNLANWELGRTTPNVDVFVLISQKLNIDIKLLIDDVDKDSEEFNSIKLALYNQLGELTEEQAADALKYIEFLKSKK